MLFLSSLQSDPGMAFVDEAFLSNPQGTMKAHLKAWFKSGRTKPPGLGICAVLNRPSESTDLFFCQTNNRFHFCCYLGDNYASAFSPIFFLPLSISRSLSLCFPHLLYCVNVRSTASACFESFSFHRNACVWEACSFGERLRCHLWYVAEND